MSYPYPGNYQHPGYGQPNEAAQIRQKNFEASQLRAAMAKGNRSPQNTPGSGVMSDNSLARPPAWSGNYAPSLDAFGPHPSQGPTQSGAPISANAGTQSLSAFGSNLPSDPNSPAVQHALDAFAPIVRPSGPSVAESLDTVHQGGAQGGVAITPYGMISAHTVAPGTPQPTSEETAAATTPNGVSHPTTQAQPQQFGGFNSAAEHASALASLRQGYPQIFNAGTPENKAFVDYAHQNGEMAAHQNVDQILGPINRPPASPTTSDPYSQNTAKNGNTLSPY